uniref:Uncharacterized protein n=1 Tax=Strigamia maritima TaxID=126957 RepID=T1IN26_STRMM
MEPSDPSTLQTLRCAFGDKSSPAGYREVMDGYNGSAIVIQQLELSYEFGKSKVGILKGLNLCVEPGTM